MGKILIVKSSLRANSNSDFLADCLAEELENSGKDVSSVSLKGKKLAFCRGCLFCQDKGECAIKDDASAISQMMHDAETIIFATPVYYYGMCGQLKTLLDRSNWLYPSDYKFRNVYLIATAAEKDRSAVDKTITNLEGWVECFPQAKIMGVFRGIGLHLPLEAKGNEGLLQEIRFFAKTI
ncbi:MAG TPA: NADPH-dependent FMN reductase [Firmicutes bacterium]|nr:NADPH-dependent FMN reductase [Bacillota bacterium]